MKEAKSILTCFVLACSRRRISCSCRPISRIYGPFFISVDRSVRTVDPWLHIGRCADMKQYDTLANSSMYFCYGLNKIINNFESYCNCFIVKIYVLIFVVWLFQNALKRIFRVITHSISWAKNVLNTRILLSYTVRVYKLYNINEQMSITIRPFYPPQMRVTVL